MPSIFWLESLTARVTAPKKCKLNGRLSTELSAASNTYGVRVVMAEPENRIFCHLDGLTSAGREQKRLKALKERGLLTAETVAVFDEATQTAARFLDAPICILGLMTQDLLLLKSAVGLSRVGLMNPLAQSRQLPRHESFCTYVVDSHQVLAIHDTANNPVLASSLLVGHYGIRAYLGAPLLTVDGTCLGTLAVMDWVPRCFTAKDIEFLAITARWCLSEFEQNRLLKPERTNSISGLPKSSKSLQYGEAWKSGSKTGSRDILNDLSAYLTSTNAIKCKLLTQLTEELRTPLTSIMGMASVLGREIYGPLTNKQKEYLEIIHHSGQHLVSLVEEIVGLGIWDETSEPLPLMSVDLEMLCQQAINSLLEMAKRRQQQIRLSVEPGSRLGFLNKDKVRHMLYYLLFSVIQSAEAGREIRIHVSRQSDLETRSLASLQIAVWVSHPWLEESLPQVYGESGELMLSSPLVVDAVSDTLETPLDSDKLESGTLLSNSYLQSANQVLSSTSVGPAFTLKQKLNNASGGSDSRESLGLLLSCHLAELHGGQISVQGSLESGYRYVICLPQLESVDERL